VAESADHAQQQPFCVCAAVLTSELGFGEAIGDFVGERLR
jgi:hypothetical protein